MPAITPIYKQRNRLFMSLTREQILAAKDRKTETINVEEWGGDVIVASMSGADRDEFDQHLIAAQKEGADAWRRQIRARLAVLCVVDENGDRVFTAADIAELGRKSAAALEPIYKAAMRLNKLGAEEVEKAAKN
jgi:hypothetical protein